MTTVEILKPGRFGKFEGRVMRSQHLDAGAIVDYPEWYALRLIADGWAVEVKAQAVEPEPETATKPETELEPEELGRSRGVLPASHAFFEIPRVTLRQALLLTTAGYTTLDELGEASDDDLLAIDGIGRATVVRIRGYLETE